MNAEDELLKKRLQELAQTCRRENRYTYTKFLNIAQLEVFYSCNFAADFAAAYGGTEGCERKVVRFGSEAELYYSEAYPIACLCASPLSQKFADALTHRDVLGALMNLGLDRSLLGDIYIKENTAWIFALEEMAGYVCDNLTKIKHTTVACSLCPAVGQLLQPTLLQESFPLVGERADALIAKVYHLSRSESAALFAAGKVLYNGRPCENPDQALKKDDLLSVRGFGRFYYRGTAGTTKKGKLNAVVEKFV